MADRVTIPDTLRAEIAADLAAGGDRAARWRQPSPHQVVVLARGEDAWPVGWVGTLADITNHGGVVTAPSQPHPAAATAWASVGGVGGGPRPEPGQRLLALRTPMRVHDGHVGICRSARPVIAEFNPEHPAERALAGSFAVTEWAILPPEIPAEVHALRDDRDHALNVPAGLAAIIGQPTPGEPSTPDSPHDDVAAILHRLENPGPAAPVDPLTVDPDQAWMCADWCCSKGCPGIGNALCGRPPCDGRICTCGNADIRAVAHDRQRLARTLRDLVRWLTVERDSNRAGGYDDFADAHSLVLDHLRGQGLDVDYLGEPAAVPDVVAREALETGDAT